MGTALVHLLMKPVLSLRPGHALQRRASELSPPPLDRDAAWEAALCGPAAVATLGRISLRRACFWRLKVRRMKQRIDHSQLRRRGGSTYAATLQYVFNLQPAGGWRKQEQQQKQQIERRGPRRPFDKLNFAGVYIYVRPKEAGYLSLSQIALQPLFHLF